MNEQEFLSRMITKGKITQAQYDKATKRISDIKAAKEKAKKANLSKAELAEIVNTFVR